MPHPIIAIVGRPNVGKSRLFNRLIGKFTALVDATHGVTRDRHYGYCEWSGKTFVVVDTGGLIPGSEDPLNQKVWAQAFLAIQEADAIVCILDGQEGVTPADQALVKTLRKTEQPKFFAVNKIDTATQEKNLADFNRLGVQPLYPVSAEHGYKVSDLLEALHKTLSRDSLASRPNTDATRLAIVGRPNVGKSTLLNHLAGQERVIVHETAGTTRDAIDVLIEKDGKQFVFVDTAGIKRKRSTRTRLEKFTVIRTLKTIEAAQFILFLLDAREPLTHQERHLIHTIGEAKKGLILLVNKWDLIKTDRDRYIAALRPRLGSLQNVPILCIAAQTGLNCQQIWKYLSK